MESGAWDQRTGSWLHGSGYGERRESRGRGLSVHLHNEHAPHPICSIYYLNLSWISFKHSISKNEASSINVKRSAATSSLGLFSFFFLILSVLGVRFLPTVRAETQSGIRAPFLGPT